MKNKNSKAPFFTKKYSAKNLRFSFFLYILQKIFFLLCSITYSFFLLF